MASSLVGQSPNLHVYFATWNAAGLKRYLDGNEAVVPNGSHAGTVGHGVPAQNGVPAGSMSGSGGNASTAHHGSLHPASASGSKSWSLSQLGTTWHQVYSASIKDTSISFNQPRLASGRPDPNARDWLGRTVLHLVCSSIDPRSFDFMTILLAHPHINVNVQDVESGWTPLHRAMWVGNIRAARELLSRTDTDLGLKDYEGLTAMDLWNSTCEGTNPAIDAAGTDLYTWGSNKNVTLGLPDPADRALPERVNLLTQRQAAAAAKDQNYPAAKSNGESAPPAFNDTSKFDQIGVRNAVMSKFHSAVLTSESRGNLSLCGLGSNGRLGKTIHTQYALLPGDLPYEIVSIALGQDHTLAVSSQGFILSWGQNKFSQLGYVIEDAPASAHKAFGNSLGDDQQMIQTTPKRIIGTLKKEFVIGVAASRLSSACWTADSVWTWGTNAGHLGYDKASNPVQVLPRKVTGISQPVLDLAMTDYALACLLDNHEVIVLHHDVVMKINFPTQRFPTEVSVYRPPAFVAKPNIVKITSSGTTFAALSSLGDVFTFNLANPVDMDIPKEGKGIVVKPQMVWALRKRFTAVKDMALGSDGTVIICTHSGHVYVRQRQNKQLKFKRVPYLQRVIRVAANESGSFAAIRSDAVPGQIKVIGSTLQEDLLRLLPHMRRAVQTFDRAHNAPRSRLPTDDDDEDDSDAGIVRDIDVALQIAQAIIGWTEADEDLTLGTDMWISVEGLSVPVHTFVIRTRCSALLSGNVGLVTAGERDGKLVLSLANCSPMSAMLLLQYLYSDDVAAVWDSRVLTRLKQAFPNVAFDVGQCRRELVAYSEALGLAKLRDPLSSTGKVAVPKTLAATLATFLDDSQRARSASGRACDLVLRLQDKDVLAHSSILTARCPFFDAMFEESEWTASRRNEDGNGRMIIDLPNLRYRSTSLVLRYIHDGLENDIFDYNHQSTLDDFLDFVFEVMAAANMFLIDRLVLVCSNVIRRHVTTLNAAALVMEAAFHNAIALKLSIQWYIACNMETMMENRLLDDMDIRNLNDLANYAQGRQGMRLPITRSGIVVDMQIEKHRSWLDDQDIARSQLRAPRVWRKRASPLLSPTTPAVKNKKGKRRASEAPDSPLAAPRTPAVAEDIFDMDDDPLPPAVTSSRPSSAIKPGQPWKSQAVESAKTDLRSIMAEASQQRTPSKPSAISVPLSGRATPSTPWSATPNKGASPTATPPLRPVTDRVASWRSPTPTQGPPNTGVNSAFPALGSSKSSPARPIAPQAGPSRPSASPLVGNVAQPSPSLPRVIVPTRLSAPPRKNSEPAWSTPAPFAAPAAPISVSPGAGGVSLLDIQKREQEMARLSLDAQRAPASLREIQEQEQRAERERAAEREFQRWWQEEEARLQRFGEEASGSRGRGRGRGEAKSRGRGRGRGGKAAGGANGDSAVGADATGERPSSDKRGGGRGGGRGRGRGSGRGGAIPSHPPTVDPASARIDQDL